LGGKERRIGSWERENKNGRGKKEEERFTSLHIEERGKEGHLSPGMNQKNWGKDAFGSIPEKEYSGGERKSSLPKKGEGIAYLLKRGGFSFLGGGKGKNPTPLAGEKEVTKISRGVHGEGKEKKEMLQGADVYRKDGKKGGGCRRTEQEKEILSLRKKEKRVPRQRRKGGDRLGGDMREEGSKDGRGRRCLRSSEKEKEGKGRH